MIRYLLLTPRDPIIARDGRPFGAGQGARMKSLDWPYPSVLAGSLRTLLGKAAGNGFSQETVEDLKHLTIAGPLPMIDDQLYLPAPKDLIAWEDEEKGEITRNILPLRPIVADRDTPMCDLPNGLTPVLITEAAKPAKMPGFWSCHKMSQWLIDESDEKFDVPPEIAAEGSGYYDVPEKDTRVHIKVDPATGAAEEKLLFMTVGLDYSRRQSADDVSLAVRVEATKPFADEISSLDTLHPFGGERRLCRWQTVNTLAWDRPGVLIEAMKNAPQVRLILATPALFEEGWKPGWLNSDLVGCPPETDVELQLVSACVDRWKPISGWSLEAGTVGPKAIRRLVPAGSVYFFNVVRGDAATLIEKLWLQPVSDRAQDRRDGFGLSLWGRWTHVNLENGGDNP